VSVGSVGEVDAGAQAPAISASVNAAAAARATRLGRWIATVVQIHSDDLSLHLSPTRKMLSC